jgi:integrase
LAHLGGQPKKRGKGLTKPAPLAKLMPLKLVNIDAAQVKAWLKQEAAVRPTRTRLAFNLFRAFCNWCESEESLAGIIAPNAYATRWARDALPRARPRTDCLQREQLPAWFAEVMKIPNTVLSVYLRVLLLTGARKESLAALKWTEVDFRWRTMTIRDKEESKGGEDGTRQIPLTPYVESLLKSLKAINELPPPRFRILHGKQIENDLDAWTPSPWVFTSKLSESGRIHDPNRQHDIACANAEIRGLTLHGLRRSFGTLTEWIDMPIGISAQIMGHKPSATAEKHYRQRPIDLLRYWHTKIEAWILKEAGIEFVSEPANPPPVPNSQVKSV